MGTIDLKTIGNDIAENISVEKIYCIQYLSNDSYYLIIIINPACDKKFTELEPFVKMATGDSDKFSYNFVHFEEFLNQLKNGNLLFHFFCNDVNLIYNRSGCVNKPTFSSEDFVKWKTAAKSNFEEGVRKTKGFIDGANFFSERKNDGLTVYMLHQFIELTFRTLELALLAKEKKTHNLRTHQELIAPFHPHLHLLFPENSDEERDILKTLNESYSSVRYKHNYQVNESYIPILFHRAYLLQKRAEQIFDHFNLLLDETIVFLNQSVHEALPDNIICNDDETSKNEISQFEIMGDEATSNYSKTLDYFLAEFIKKYAPQVIYNFGNIHHSKSTTGCFLRPSKKESVHMFLVVILPNAGIQLMNEMQEYANANFSGGQITIVAQSWEYIFAAMNSGKTFYNNILRKGILLYKKGESEYDKLVIPEIDHIAVLNSAEKVYKVRKETAEGFLLAAKNCLEAGYFNNALFFLHQATEQACLQSIRLHIDYRCEVHNIGRLLDLVECFKPGLKILLKCSVNEDNRLFKLLKDSYSSSRYRTDFKVDKQDVIDLYDQVNSFVTEADVISFSKLGHLINSAHEFAQVQNDLRPALTTT